MIKVLLIHSPEDPSKQIRTTHKTGGPDLLFDLLTLSKGFHVINIAWLNLDVIFLDALLIIPSILEYFLFQWIFTIA
jgi:hypothetical protein